MIFSAKRTPWLAALFAAVVLCAQDAPASGSLFTVEPNTKVPLALINSVSTKHSAQGDRVYLETVFPILVNGRIVVPVGSWVMGTVTQVKKPGRVKGRAELYVRFDSRLQRVTNKRVSEDIVLDVGKGEKIIGIEIMNASRKVDLAQIQPVNFEIVG